MEKERKKERKAEYPKSTTGTGTHFIFVPSPSSASGQTGASIPLSPTHNIMDFGRPMIRTPGIVARSGIRLVSETHLGDDPLDVGVCRAANEAARDLLLGNDRASGDDDGGADADDGGGRTENDGGMRRRRALALALVDSSLYRERHLPPPTRLIRSGDLVVVFESFNDLNFVYATPGDVFSNRNGHFHHDDFIGHPYGCKIRSRNGGGMGFLYLLRPTPELWTRSLPHRTQIVHELDASMIVHYLDVGPDMVVCESGTGSGAMSHALLRSISPSGMLHTYEFNRMRAEKARMEFTGHGLGHVVEVHHRDVCGSGGGGGGGGVDADDHGVEEEEGEEEEEEEEEGGRRVRGGDDDGDGRRFGRRRRRRRRRRCQERGRRRRGWGRRRREGRVPPRAGNRARDLPRSAGTVARRTPRRIRHPSQRQDMLLFALRGTDPADVFGASS